MTITTRQDKINAIIERAKSRLAKLQSMTPEQIAKKYPEHWFYEVDVDRVKEQIENNINKLEEAKRLDAKEESKAKAKKVKEEAEAKLLSAIPAEMEKWFDDVKRNSIIAMREARHLERYNKSRNKNYVLASMSNEEIERDVERKIENMKLNLLDRVSEKCGEIKGCRNVRVETGNINEGTAVNGTFYGTKGTATVKSVMAGGFNIQRLHVRVLVK